ncbi:MAG: RHS repeat-associated core domain-containing protein [Verrucomicrobiota bacterium]
MGDGKPALVASADYDAGFATVVSSTDFNTNVTSCAYDSLGRLVHLVRPYDSQDYPTVEYTYGLAVPAGTNGLINFIETRRRDQAEVLPLKSAMYFFSREFVDGLGRKLLTKTEAEPAPGSTAGRVIVSQATCYNARQKPAAVMNPCFSLQTGETFSDRLSFERIDAPGWQGAFQVGSNLVTLDFSSAPKASMGYDATLRAVTETNQDGTFRQTVYEPLVVRSYDENQTDPASAYYENSMARFADGLGRLIRVDEMTHLHDDGSRGAALNTWTTRYQYNVRDQLTRMTDSLQNVKTTAYDGLKRKTFSNDPDRGQRHDEYDEASNLVQTTDAKGQRTTFTYDGANRILTECYHDGSGAPPWRDGQDTNAVAYVYDTPVADLSQGDHTTATARNTRGLLAYVRDLAGEEHFSYDARGRTVYSVKRIPDPVFLSRRKPGLQVPLVDYRTGLEYDPFDRITRLVFPDNDEVRFEFNDRTLVQRIIGGPNTNIISSITYLPSGQRRQVDYGNGVCLTSDYDARLRQTILDGRHTILGTKFISFAYEFDPVSNIRSITDLRPLADIPAADPRRNTQTFAYDDLYRLTKAQYNQPNPPASNGGELAYAYDRVANLVTQTSDIVQHENGESVTQLGNLSYGGSAGSSGRVGRAPADPPGPHAVTALRDPKSANPLRQCHYDANGNMTSLDGLTNSWDFKDRLAACESTAMRAEYTYDYLGRRILKRVWPKTTGASAALSPEPTSVVYVNPTFELRDYDAPTKYVFNAAVRVARVTGSLSTNPRIQRFRVYAGWNLCSLAVTARQALAQWSAGNRELIRAAYYWSPAASSWLQLGFDETVPQGTVLWIDSGSDAVLTAIGSYAEPIHRPVPTGGTFLPSAGLQAWNITNGLPVNLTVWLRPSPPGDDPWRIRFPLGLAAFSPPPACLAPGQALFVQSDTEALVQPPPPGASILYYHQDHLGSSSVITDADGALVEETAFYPSGLPRHQYLAGSLSDPYQFAQKERDSETGLWHFQARYLASQLSRFISVDPKYVDPESLSGQAGRDFLAQPQLHNLYAFAACNPLKYMDADGLEVVWSADLQRNRRFQRAMQILKSSGEGQRVLAALENANITAGVGQGEHDRVAGEAKTRTEFQGSDRTGWRRVTTVAIKIDVEKAARENVTDHELANVLHHELRHAEIHTEALPGEDLSTWAKVEQWEKRRDKADRKLDVYIPSDLPTSKGTGIQTLDERNHQFQVEIGLRMSEADENATRQANREKIERYREQIRARQGKH